MTIETTNQPTTRLAAVRINAARRAGLPIAVRVVRTINRAGIVVYDARIHQNQLKKRSMWS